MGIFSAKGTCATSYSSLPFMSQTWMFRGKERYVIRYENGFCTVVTKMCFPSGDAEAPANNAGLAIRWMLASRSIAAN